MFMKKALLSIYAFMLTLAIMTGCTKEAGENVMTESLEQSTGTLQNTTVSTTLTPEPYSETITEASPEKDPFEDMIDKLEHKTDSEDAPVVYMTTDISPEGLIAAYEALGRIPAGNVAIKLHTGEGEASNYLRPEFIKDFVQLVNGTIVECNTAYGGNRANTAMHLQLAEDRGFTAIAPVDIMDAEGGMEIPIIGGIRLQTNEVGASFVNYDFFVILSHFKGHAMGGFGGALKNMSVGIASSEGKSLIHTGGGSRSGYGPYTPVDTFTESMAEAAKSVSDYLDNGNNILYINVMNNISVDCDCNAHPQEPIMEDVGILASLDPVALDQACVDLVYVAPYGYSVVDRIESRNGVHILEHSEAIGFGSRYYRLVIIDD